jgi:hypothetical protein
MSMVIVLEIVVAIVVLAVAVRFAVRDTRQRRDANNSPEQRFASEDTDGTQLPGSEHDAQQRPSEVADHRAGEEVAAVGASSAAPEPPADAR